MKKMILWIVGMCISSVLYADFVTVYQMDDEKQTFMYRDATHAKMVNTNGDDKSSIYVIGKKTYIVNEENGQKTVMDMDEMKAMMNSFGGAKANIKHEAQKRKAQFTINKTRKREKVAGIVGEVWMVEGKEDGKKFTQRVVVSKDKRVAKSMHAMFAIIANISDEPMDDTMGFLEIEKGYVVIQADGMKLISFREDALADSEFALPKDAKKQHMPDIAGILGGSNGKNSNSILDKCYSEVCCGSTAGPSKVLAPMLNSRSNGYRLDGSGVCNALGLASTFGIKTVEGALYSKGNDHIQITLNLDDDSKGAVRQSRKQVQSGMSPVVTEVKNYRSGRMNGAEYYYGYFLPMKQETLDIIIDETTILSVTRKSKSSPIDLIEWAKDTIDLYAFEYNPDVDDESYDEEDSDDDVQEAVDMLKSFF